MMEVRTFNQNTIEVTLMIHTNEKIIKHKVGLINLAEELKGVSGQVCHCCICQIAVLRSRGLLKWRATSSENNEGQITRVRYTLNNEGQIHVKI